MTSDWLNCDKSIFLAGDCERWTLGDLCALTPAVWHWLTWACWLCALRYRYVIQLTVSTYCENCESSMHRTTTVRQWVITASNDMNCVCLFVCLCVCLCVCVHVCVCQMSEVDRVQVWTDSWTTHSSWCSALPEDRGFISHCYSVSSYSK